MTVLIQLPAPQLFLCPMPHLTVSRQVGLRCLQHIMGLPLLAPSLLKPQWNTLHSRPYSNLIQPAMHTTTFTACPQMASQNNVRRTERSQKGSKSS